MYCIKCGVALADSEKVCPLCKTEVFHPHLSRADALPMYPDRRMPKKQMNRRWIMTVLTVLIAIVFLQLLFFDWRLNGAVSWSFFASGGIFCAYFLFLFPFWFRRFNPTIFVPVDFLVVGCYLLGMDLFLKGGWFLPFALPLLALAALLTIPTAILLYYLPRGVFYIMGGTALGTGFSLVLAEALIDRYFAIEGFVFWSLSPLLGLSVLGIFLIVVGIVRPLRERLEKKLFI